MSIKYKVARKVYQEKEIFHATESVDTEVTTIDLVEELSRETRFSPGDLLCVLEMIPAAIEKHAGNGKKVNIKGLGTFCPSLSSDSYDAPVIIQSRL